MVLGSQTKIPINHTDNYDLPTYFGKFASRIKNQTQGLHSSHSTAYCALVTSEACLLCTGDQ